MTICFKSFLSYLALVSLIALSGFLVGCGGSGDEQPDPGDQTPTDREVQVTWAASSVVLPAAGTVNKPVGSFTLSAKPLNPAIVKLSVNAGNVLAHAGACALSWQAAVDGRVVAKGAAAGVLVEFALAPGAVAAISVSAALSSTVPTYCEWAGVVVRYTVVSLP